MPSEDPAVYLSQLAQRLAIAGEVGEEDLE